jgi:hypothetical protein
MTLASMEPFREDATALAPPGRARPNVSRGAPPLGKKEGPDALSKARGQAGCRHEQATSTSTMEEGGGGRGRRPELGDPRCPWGRDIFSCCKDVGTKHFMFFKYFGYF